MEKDKLRERAICYDQSNPPVAKLLDNVQLLTGGY